MKKRLVKKKVAFCRARTGEIEGLRHAYPSSGYECLPADAAAYMTFKKLNSYPSFEGRSQG